MPPKKKTTHNKDGNSRAALFRRNRAGWRREILRRLSAALMSNADSSSAISMVIHGHSVTMHARESPTAELERPSTSFIAEPSSTLAPVESRQINVGSSTSIAEPQDSNDASAVNEVPQDDESGAMASQNGGSQMISRENNVNNMYVYADNMGSIVQQPQFSRESPLTIVGRPAVYAGPSEDNSPYFYLAPQSNTVQRPQFRGVPYLRNPYVNQNINGGYQPHFAEEYSNSLLVTNSYIPPYYPRNLDRSCPGCQCHVHRALNRQAMIGNGFNYFASPVQNSGYLYCQHVHSTPLVLCNCAIIVGNSNQLPGQHNNPTNLSLSQLPDGQEPSSDNDPENNQNTE